jgi:putative hydrolase of the HAD superfamily
MSELQANAGGSEPGASVPRSGGADADLDLAAQYAPVILFDEAEPFLPLVVGVTVFRGEGESRSFGRRISREFTPDWRMAIEYAIWWDWDIGHLYELEHAWSYVGEDGRLVWAEASWHGDYSAMSLAGGRVACEGNHPLLYSQPGKHAFAPEAICLERVLHFVVKDAALAAGEGGVLLKEQYAPAIALEEGDHARAAAYLAARAFVPAMRFTQRFAIGRELLVPWPALDSWIPARVNWWLEQLRG